MKRLVLATAYAAALSGPALADQVWWSIQGNWSSQGHFEVYSCISTQDRPTETPARLCKDCEQEGDPVRIIDKGGDLVTVVCGEINGVPYEANYYRAEERCEKAAKSENDAYAAKKQAHDNFLDKYK